MNLTNPGHRFVVIFRKLILKEMKRGVFFRYSGFIQGA